MTRTTEPTTRMADTNTLSAPVALREILRGAASAADASWIGRVVTWFSLARRSVERAGKRQKCQEITETNGPGRVNGGRTAPPAFANFAAHAVRGSPNGSGERLQEVPAGERQGETAQQPPQTRFRDPWLHGGTDPATGQTPDPGGQAEAPVRGDRPFGVRRDDGVRRHAHDRRDPGARQRGRGDSGDGHPG